MNPKLRSFRFVANMCCSISSPCCCLMIQGSWKSSVILKRKSIFLVQISELIFHFQTVTQKYESEYVHSNSSDEYLFPSLQVLCVGGRHWHKYCFQFFFFPVLLHAVIPPSGSFDLPTYNKKTSSVPPQKRLDLADEPHATHKL